MPLSFNSFFSFSAWQMISKGHLSRTARAFSGKNVFYVQTKFKASAISYPWPCTEMAP